MTIRQAVMRGGQPVVKEPVPIPDGTEVTVRIDETADDPLQFLADNAVDMGVPDTADEHDHYIYGTPKRANDS